jgi:nicotinate-nucleotide adenylyltransferase
MIGVYGGTFDPVHYGHLRPALEILEAFELSQIRFIPCGQPPHREPPHASAAQRLAMLHLAIAGIPGFITDAREIQRAGPSYMIDTLRSLQGELAGEHFCLILGMDAFAAFHTWHDWRSILQVCNLLVMHRPEFEPAHVIQNAELKQLVAENLLQDKSAFINSAAGKLMFYTVTQLDISSTRIRDVIKHHRSARYLLPDDVIALIEQDNIYH